MPADLKLNIEGDAASGSERLAPIFGRVAALEQSLSKYRQAIAEQQAQNAVLTAQLNSILASRSWRMTRVLRFGACIVRGDWSAVRAALRPRISGVARTIRHWPAKAKSSSKAKSSLTVPATSRARQLLGPIDRSARIVEIGPSHNPIAPKAGGWKTTTVDHASRDDLVKKYAGQPGVDVSRIEHVDCIWTAGSLADAIPRPLHGTFDAFIASHVIEHSTDLIGFLDAAESLLSPNGTVILAVPDKRYCFDYFRPATTTSEVLHANATGRSRHTRRIAFDHTAYVVNNDGNGAWGQHPIGRIEFYHTLEEAGQVFAAVNEDPSAPYRDFHAWQFTPASFELLLLELARLKKTDWQIQRITPAMGCEFHAWLRRGGGAATAAMSQSVLNARRLDLLKQSLLQTRQQIDFLVTDDAFRYQESAVQR
jgi:hypothetical protein